MIEALNAEIDGAVERYLATPPQPPEAIFDFLYAELPPTLAGQRAAVAGSTHEGGNHG